MMKTALGLVLLVGCSTEPIPSAGAVDGSSESASADTLGGDTSDAGLVDVEYKDVGTFESLSWSPGGTALTPGWFAFDADCGISNGSFYPRVEGIVPKEACEKLAADLVAPAFTSIVLHERECEAVTDDWLSIDLKAGGADYPAYLSGCSRIDPIPAIAAELQDALNKYGKPVDAGAD